jgi:hypothetical protein
MIHGIRGITSLHEVSLWSVMPNRKSIMPLLAVMRLSRQNQSVLILPLIRTFEKSELFILWALPAWFKES